MIPLMGCLEQSPHGPCSVAEVSNGCEVYCTNANLERALSQIKPKLEWDSLFVDPFKICIPQPYRALHCELLL